MLYSLNSANIDFRHPLRLDLALKSGSAKLEACLGMQMISANEPAVHEMLMQDVEFLDMFEEVCKDVYIGTIDLDARPAITEAIMEPDSTRGFGDQPRIAALLPIESIAGKGVNAVLIVGTNTRRPYDADCEAFLRDLGRSVSSMLASLILNNEQKKRVGEALQAEKRAVSMLEASPVGACLIARDGVMLYANSSFATITSFEYDAVPFSWLDMMLDESAKRAKRSFDNVVERGQEVTLELVLKKPWLFTDPVTGEDVIDQTHILVSALLERLGGEEYCISVVTDISYQKWMESLHDKRRQQALDMKRAQENFMDMTSHEMRNPLSAIFQCADQVVTSLSRFQATSYEQPDLVPNHQPRPFNQRSSIIPGIDPKLAEALSEAIEAAGTITLCAQHQRRIVDDVLVLSKVDAQLIEIHPVEVQPRLLIENAIKMFAAELAANQASMRLEIEQSFSDLAVDWVRLDPGRLLQIFINLCTNAIKFTMDCKQRDIMIAIGASAEIPDYSSRGVRFLHGVSDEEFEDPTTKPEWGDGEELYLMLQVTDTGKGMTQDEMKLLFQRVSVTK
jgi:signal transduction histidine kinase